MFYTYILQSKLDRKIYIGSTKDLRKRLSEHNNGLVRSTKSRTPFELVYYEAYKVEGSARSREKSLKLRGRARVQLLKRIADCL